MNTRHVLVICTLLLCVGKTFCQRVDVPAGNAVTTITHGNNQSTWTHKFPGVHISCTTNCFNWSNPFSVDFTDSWLKTWCAPPGTSIVDCQYEPVLNNGNLVFNVLLDNGTIQQFTIGWGGRLVSTAVSDVPSTGDPYQQVVGDALYTFSGTGIETSVIHVSRDEAKTWSVDTTGLNGAHVRCMAVDTNQNVYAATADGLFSQSGTGTTWSKLTTPLATGLCAVIADARNRVVVGDTLGGSCMSTNAGATWSTASLPKGHVARFESDSIGTLFAITQAPQGLYKYDGTAWIRIDQTLAPLVGPFVQYSDIDIDVNGYNVATSAGLFLSTDVGATWNAVGSGLAERAYSIAQFGGTSLMSTDLGIFRHTSGGSWTKIFPMNGYESAITFNTSGIGTVNAVAQNTDTAALGAPIIFSSTDAGTTWQPDTAGLGALASGAYMLSTDGAGNEHFVMGYSPAMPTQTVIVLEKKIGGAWTRDTAGLGSAYFNDANVPIVADSAGNLWLAGNFAAGPVLRRAASGGTWTLDTAGMGASPAVQYLSAGQSGVCAGNNFSIWYRANGGAWRTIAFPPDVPAYCILHALAMDAHGILWSSFFGYDTSGGVYFSNNLGASWTRAGLNGTQVTTIQGSGDSVFVMSDRGIFSLHAQASTQRAAIAPQAIAFGTVASGAIRDSMFAVINTGTQTLMFDSAKVDNPDFILSPTFPMVIWPGLSATAAVEYHSNGAKDIGNISVVGDGSAFPLALTLSGNASSDVQQFIPGAAGMSIFPNPAKNNFQLSIDASFGARCDVALVNMLGVVVAAPNAAELRDRNVHITFEHLQLPAGLYFCRITGERESRALPLLIAE